MRKLSGIVFALLISFTSHAQEALNKDSLEQVLSVAKEDTNKVKLYIDIGNQFELNDPQTAAMYYLQAGKLSKRLNYKQGMVKYIFNYTGILNLRGNYDSSLLLNKQAIQYAKEINDKLLEAKAYANTGNSFQFSSQYDSALFYYETARSYFEQTGNILFQARMMDLLQNTYRELNQDEKALTLSKQAVSLLRGSSVDSQYLAMAIINMATNYTYLQQDSSLKYFNEGLAISSRLNYKEAESTCLNNIGNIYFKRYDAENMKPYFERAYQISEELGLPYGMSASGRGLAFYYLLKNNYDEAKNQIEKALIYSDSIQSGQEKVENLKALASILFAMHDIVGAEKILDSATRIENIINGNELKDRTLSIEKKFETQKKESQIKLQQAELHKKNMLNYVFAGSAVSLLLILLLGYRNYRNRQKLQQTKIEELETEKQLTATEAVLKGEEQERSRLAKDLHDGLGGMLSGIKHSLSSMKENLIMTPDNAQAFERSIDMLDSSIKEMRRVAHNLMPEILIKYGLDTALKEYCDSLTRSGIVRVKFQSMGMNEVSLEQTTEVTIYRIVQELANNAIKHGTAQNLVVQAHASVSEKIFALTVEDDGKGFDVASLKQSRGMGWNNIQNRVEFLKGRIDIGSEPGKGISVLIEINI